MSILLSSCWRGSSSISTLVVERACWLPDVVGCGGDRRCWLGPCPTPEAEVGGGGRGPACVLLLLVLVLLAATVSGRLLASAWKKIDGTIRGSAALVPFLLLLVAVVVAEVLRAVMEPTACDGASIGSVCGFCVG